MQRRLSKLYGSLAMPHIRGSAILSGLSSLLDTNRFSRLHEFVDERHRKHGLIHRGRLGPVEAIFVGSANAARELFRVEGPCPQNFVPEAWLLYNQMRHRRRGLLFMQGEEWLRNRRILNKALLGPDSASTMVQPCREAAEDLVKKWKVYTNNDRIVPELEYQLYQWSIEVLLACLVGRSWTAYKSKIGSDLELLSRNLARVFEHSARLCRLPAKLAMFAKLPSWQGFVQSADAAFGAVDRLVDDLPRDDPEALITRFEKLGMQQDDIARIVIDLILAAGDTTAYCMQWLLLLLSRSSEVQVKLQERLAELKKRANDKTSDYESDLLHEPILKGSIRESLRLYPIAPFLMRLLPEDTLLDGYPAYKGELVVISLYTLGRDESSFPKPNHFEPERWLRDDRGGFARVSNPNGSLPFAMGARSCVGRKLADTQMAITVASILENFNIDCLNKDKISMKLRMISAPSEPLQLKLINR
ncbi:hypothetical protein QAD02_015711 [Eretmocerus hayati]|uniref:Uncharacterized protein n=1 Tax=Eretmocerus hayati TaxID=131215 RepID=A0ACC2PBG3_9HYME|nr:hypothetical protein QAD02_015711 [Eretmocerus hayati]